MGGCLKGVARWQACRDALLEDLRSIGEGVVMVARIAGAEVARYLAAFDHANSPAGSGAPLQCVQFANA